MCRMAISPLVQDQDKVYLWVCETAFAPVALFTLPTSWLPRSLWNSLNHRMLKSRPASVTRTLLSFMARSCGMRQFISSWRQEKVAPSWRRWKAVDLWENLRSFGWPSISSKALNFFTQRELYIKISNVRLHLHLSRCSSPYMNSAT